MNAKNKAASTARVPRYVVVLRGSSAAQFSETDHLILKGLQIPTGPTDFIFRTRYVDEGFEARIPRELWVDVRGPAPNLNTAVQTFGSVAGDLAIVLAVGSNAQIETLDVELAYDETPGLRERKFFQSFLPDEQGIPRAGRRPDANAVRLLIIAVAQHAERERIHRAMAHYYEALRNWAPGRETVAVGYLWIGMESLTPLAVREECSKAGFAVNARDQLAQQLGVDEEKLDAEIRLQVLFQGDKECYDQARSARVGLQHGFMSFDQVRTLSAAARDRTASYLRQAILGMASVDDETRNKLSAPPFDTPQEWWRIEKYLRATLLADTDQLAAEGQEYPIFTWRSRLKAVRRDEAGKLAIEPTEELTARLNEGVLFRPESVEMWGPTGYKAFMARRSGK